MHKLSQEDYLKIKKTIVRKLYVKRAFCQGHLLFERLQSGIPLHLVGFVKYVLNDLIKKSIVKVYSKTKYGKAYQLNIEQLEKIEKML